MTINLIQHKVATNAGSPGSITVNPTMAKSLIIVMVEGIITTVTSITDNAPGSSSLYVQVPNARATDATTNLFTDIWYSANSLQKATTITVTLNNNVAFNIWVFEVQIMNSSSPFQESGVVNNGASTLTPVGASVITSNPLDFIANITTAANAITGIHAGNNFTIGDIQNGDASAYLITSQNGTYQPQFDVNIAGTFCSSTASFREAPHSIDTRGIRDGEIHTRFDYYEG